MLILDKRLLEVTKAEVVSECQTRPRLWSLLEVTKAEVVSECQT
jgi:hypothetical protein